LGGDAVTLFDVAAAMGHSICRNRHPFVDGNMRASWFTSFVTLRLNLYHPDAREAEATDIVRTIAEGSCSEADLTAFLADNVRKPWRVSQQCPEKLKQRLQILIA